MGLCIIHVHVEALGRGVDLIVELVRPGPDDLLQIVVTELAVVKRVIASVDRIFLIWRCPLQHHRASGLISGIFLPKRDIGPVRQAELNCPLIVDLAGRENSGLCIIIESVNDRVTLH